MGLIPGILFPFIRFTNWKQAKINSIVGAPGDVSIHTLHELEASRVKLIQTNPAYKSFHSYASRIGSKVSGIIIFVSMSNGFHSYASRIGSKTPRTLFIISERTPFPFIRFTNWKQVAGKPIHEGAILCFHSYASRIGSKYCSSRGTPVVALGFPFIRFTNWKQVAGKPIHEGAILCFHSYASRIGSKMEKYRAQFEEGFVFPFIRFTNWKQACCKTHGYKTLCKVSIHTLHELEARWYAALKMAGVKAFPFIRFTNWKQVSCVRLSKLQPKPFPFIRFTNWKQD